jgi:hypothetical protein
MRPLRKDTEEMTRMLTSTACRVPCGTLRWAGFSVGAQMKSRLLSMLAGVALAASVSLVWATSASADLLHYTLDFSDPATPDISWDLSRPLQLSGSDGSITFSVSLIFNASIPLNDITFYSAAGGGGLESPGAFDLEGPQLFTGSVLAPTLLEGVFDLHGAGTNTATLSVTAAVPEPSTWAMMILGFAGVSFMAYRRSRKDQGLALAA